MLESMKGDPEDTKLDGVLAYESMKILNKNLVCLEIHIPIKKSLTDNHGIVAKGNQSYDNFWVFKEQLEKKLNNILDDDPKNKFADNYGSVYEKSARNIVETTTAYINKVEGNNVSIIKTEGLMRGNQLQAWKITVIFK